MPDVQYPYAVIENPVENLIRIANERCDAHAGPFRHRLGGLGILSDMCNDLSNFQFDGESNPIASPYARLSAAILRRSAND
jgi:hypothetical protein